MVEKLHHHVYVVLLDAAVLQEWRVLTANPKRDPAEPCVYVGMTGIPPIRGGLQTVIIGGLASAAAFGLARWIS